MSNASWFNQLLASAVRKRHSSRRKLQVEALEDRRVPATFVPDVFTDEFDGNFNPGDLSLREAVHLANTTAGADTIPLLPSVYLLSRPGRGENNNLTGDLDVMDPAGLTILRPVTAPSIIDADGIDRAFEVIGSGALTLISVTVRGGSETNGGGFSVSSQGSLTLEDSVVHSNLATNRGGGVDNSGTLTIVGSTFVSNIAGDFEFFGAGGAIHNNSGRVSIENSEFTSNDAFVEGGAINDRNGKIDVTASIFMHNRAHAAGGGGGAISTIGTTLSIADSTLSGNIAVKGGAIQGRGTVTITGSLLEQNQATIQAGANNLGGAIYNTQTMKVVNSTIVDNIAGSSTGLGFGGAIDNIGAFQLIHVTVTGNRASDGGGIRTSGTAALFTVNNSIIAQNTTTAAGNRLDVWGAFNSLGGNFIGYAGGSAGWIDSDQRSNNGLLDPKLGPLQYHGGLTFTRAPLAGSPVLDAGVDFIPLPVAITLPDTDQRGLPRPSGPGYDIGAYEHQTTTPVNRAPVAGADTYAVDEDSTLVVAAPGLLGNDSDPDGDSVTAVLVIGPAHGTLALNGDGSLIYTPAVNYHGPDSFTYRAFDGEFHSNIATVSLTVNPINDAPIASSDGYSVDQNASLAVSAVEGVLANDSDVDGDQLTVALVAGPANGSLTLHADGSFAYVPAFRFHGADSFTYQAGDGEFVTAPVTVTVTVKRVTRTVPIDVAPGDSANTIDINRDSKVDVVILSTATFDAQDVIVESLRFGKTGTEDSLMRHQKTGRLQFRYEDVNGDGRLDLIVAFDVGKTGLAVGDSTAVLRGELLDGTLLQAVDVINVVASNKPGKGRK
jgi:hypothetical protein